MAALYRLLTRLGLPVALAYLWWRGRRDPGYRAGLGERLGYLPRGLPPGGLWLHAASVGEVQAAVPLIRALAARGPLLVTTNTPTGLATLRRRCGEDIAHAYLPLDTPGATARFLAGLQPRAAVLVELELWPNLLRGLAVREVPVVLANARLSARSLARYRRLGGLLRDACGALAAVGAQTADDAERLAALGVPAARITVTGNLKFDQAPDPGQVAEGERLRAAIGPERPVWVAASVRDGEEAAVLDAHRAVLARCPAALLVAVPRHPERFGPLGQRIAEAGLGCARRSAAEIPDDATPVLLADTMGELAVFLAAADVVFVGGSLVPVGGHNPLEPAALGRPVLMGPEVVNVRAIDALLGEAGGRIRVADAAALAEAVSGLLADPGRRRQAGDAAAAVVSAHRGAAARTLSLIDAVAR